MRIEDLIGQDYELDGHGRWLRSIKHDSLVVDTTNQVFFWNSRDIYYGTAFTWLIVVKQYDVATAMDMLKDISIILPRREYKKPLRTVVSYAPLVDIFFERGRNHREYWYNKRGYTDKTIDDYKLGYTGEWYTIPIYVDGEFVTFQCRKETPKRVKGWYAGLGPQPFNFSLLPMVSWVVLTEGPVDAIMLRQYDIPAVSQTGGSGYWNPAWNSKFMDFDAVYIVYDYDKAGIMNSLKVAENFGYRAQVVLFENQKEGFDITDYFKQGATKEDFMKLLKKNARYYFEHPKIEKRFAC